MWCLQISCCVLTEVQKPNAFSSQSHKRREAEVWSRSEEQLLTKSKTKRDRDRHTYVDQSIGCRNRFTHEALVQKLHGQPCTSFGPQWHTTAKFEVGWAVAEKIEGQTDRDGASCAVTSRMCELLLSLDECVKLCAITLSVPSLFSCDMCENTTSRFNSSFSLLNETNISLKRGSVSWAAMMFSSSLSL